METLTFTEVNGRYESDVVNFTEDSAIELTFTEVPVFNGVDIDIWQSVSGNNWQKCFHDTLRNDNTYCKSIKGVSTEASYKIICSLEPSSAYYV